MSALTFDKSELGNLEYSLQREMLSTDRIGGYEYDDRLLQHPPLSRTDGGPHRRQRPDLRPALVARRDRGAARPDVQSGAAPFQGGIRAARPQVYHRFRVYADADDHLPRGRRNPQEGDALDPQADAADDPLHARGRPLRNPAAAAAVPRLPRQACADARQHGGRRTLLPRRKRREVPSLQLVPVALSPDEQTRHGVRARARLVLRIRIPAGAGPRIRGVRRPAHDGLFRSGAQEGREHHLLGVARRNGLDQNHRRGFRRIHRAAYA